jgi:hypothetical protein
VPLDLCVLVKSSLGSTKYPFAVKKKFRVAESTAYSADFGIFIHCKAYFSHKFSSPKQQQLE